MGKITLAQILQYLTFDDDRGLIQIVMSDHDWDDAYEVTADCELLEPFYDYIVTDLRSEEAFIDCKPVIRVGIEKNNIIKLSEYEGRKNDETVEQGL